MSDAIAAKNITKTYQNGDSTLYALKGVNLTVSSGDIHVLMGPSGSGKTTLLSILGGILTPTSGDIELLGETVTHYSRRKLAQFRMDNIGFIFQGFNLFPALTALENIQVALKLKGIKGKESRDIAQHLLQQVGLADKLASRPANLSGGQKQRVAIARALAGNPPLIMADEPTAALDSKQGRNILELLKSLAKEEGCTVLMVTHDPRIIDLADQVVHLEDGMISPESGKRVGALSE